MFRRKLFKHVLSRRALPIILSVAMTFQSMPATALAAENQAVEETASNENALNENVLNENALNENASNENALNENASNENAGADNTADDAGNASEADAGSTDTTTGAEASETAGEGTSTASEVQISSEEESGQNGEVSSAEDASSISDETEAAVEAAAEEETPSQPEEKAASVAKIIVDDKKVDDYAKGANGFTRILGEKDLVFFTEYVEQSKCGQFQQAIGDWLSIEVDGEKVDTLKDRLTYHWVKKAAGGEETDTPLINAFPGDAGAYELTISMDLADMNGLCEKLENDLKVFLTIEKADVGLDFEKSVAPGKTAGDFIDAVNKDYVIKYKKDNSYNVSRDVLAISDAEGKDDPDKKLPLHVFVIDESGERQPMDMMDRFDRTKDYVLTIDDIALTENAAKNYELSVEDSYIIEVGERQETAVRFELKDPGKDLIEVYDPDKAWTIDEVTKDLFAEAVADGTGAVAKTGGMPTVFILGKEDEEDTVLEGADPEAEWYTRIRLNTSASYQVDEDAGEIRVTDDKDNTFIYKPLSADPVDAGEYFIIWSYAGDDSAYEKSYSEAVRFTVDPAPVVIQISPDSIAAANFRDGMDADAVRKALAKISYGVYPLVTNETTGAMEAGSTAVETTPDFFGTAYAGDVEEQTTQYYVPEFILQRRLVRITETGEATVDVDPRAVVWEKVTGSIKVVVDEETELAKLKEQLPESIPAGKLESAEYEFRIYFTGNKVLYDNNGKIVPDKDKTLSVTDVTTNAANRNYLADITDKMLEDTAVPVPVEGMKTEEVQILTDAIVDAFIADNKDSLDPQLDGGETGETARAKHPGTLENPAVKIYDQNALFTDRASYKKAAVYKIGEDGGIGESLSVLPTDEALVYTWSYTTLEKYETYLEKWDEVQREYKDFEEFNDSNSGELGWTDAADGTLNSFRNAGLYRLTVTYNDPEYAYKSAKAEVFFKVNRQEIIIVPGQQYVKNGDRITSLTGRIGKVNKEDFTVYKLPHNSIDEYNALTDEAKSGYALPTDEEIAEYEAENGQKPDLMLGSLTWEVLRKEKDPASGLDKEPAEWIKLDSANFDEDFTYGVVAHWTGSIDWLSGNDYNDNSNYTTRDVKTYKATGENRHHESVGAVRFYERQIYVEADAEKIKALGHEYDGEPVDLKEAAKALSFYTDGALTESSRLSTETIVNTTDEYDPAKINIYWEKNGHTYANKNAVYGGTYTLKLRFEGGELNTAATAGVTVQDHAVPGTYAPLDGNGWMQFDDISFIVSPREITITPKTVSEDLIVAGEKADTLLKEEIDVQGIVEDDQKFFGYVEIASEGFDVCYDGKNEDGTDKEKPAYIYRIDKKGGYPAFNSAASYIIQVDGREIKNPGSEYLRFGSAYTIKLTNNLATPLKESYKVTYKTVEIKVEKRGSADITPINDSIDTLSAKGIDYEFNDGTYTIRPRGAVKFYYNTGTGISAVGRDGTETLKNTNILGFRIYAPKEFMNDFNAAKEKFVYQNAVWNAGGYFLNTSEWVNNGYITVVFPLTKEETEKSFNITWEDGYTETFTLADVVLEEDFTKAVVPKSLAFNGVSGKMAAGETQQLNLKITKAQLGDVINIRYRIKGGGTKNEYISLDPETGLVTALKAGKAATVVEAYPVYKDAKGNFVPVTDSKGKEAKAASTKITVTEVTASSVKKITAQGELAKLYFTVPDDGYRREIYVADVTKGTAYADRKKWKPADFDKAIAGMTNGEWENAGFAVKPIYSYADNSNLEQKETDGQYDRKLKAHILTIGGLETEHEYVVYVRNVSAARELQDGSVVSLSTGGKVKSFKTTKPQVQELELDFTVKTGENDKKNTVTHPVNEDGTIAVDEYTVELSAKKAQLNVYGYFSDRAGGNDAAEDRDRRRYSLVPTLKEEKAALKNYLMPKLVYVVYDEPEEEPFRSGLQQSKYATISNKGMITLKGVDLNGEKTVHIYVRDSFQHEDDYDSDAVIALTITAKPAAVKGKSVKMKVGQTIKLSDYLEYKDEKKKKIPDYRSCGVAITKEMIAEAEANGYVIKDEGPSELIHDWRITAVSPNKAKFNLEVTDFDADGNEMKATVTLTSAQIDAVKGLKVSYVDDRYITINFTHSANSNEADNGSVYDYALEVKDARGNVVDKIVLSKPHVVSDIDGVNSKELKNALTWIQYKGTRIDSSNPKNKKIMVSGNRGFNYYTGTRTKAKTFAYTYYSEKLVRLSSYTISVTPLYGNQKAEKAATVRTKTTNIPASYQNVDLTGAIPDRLGGYQILTLAKQKYEDDTTQTTANKAIDIPYRFISGSTYTLNLGTYIVSTKERCSDTLTWKSSNTKVATVKANPGTYTATFKTLNQGTTTITLTSKITKKVIVRYKVKVYAIKDGSNYGGDYEPTWNNGFYEKILALYDPYYEGRLEVLSENVPLVIDNGENPNIETWVSFTAPHYGKYTLTLDETNLKTAFYDGKDGKQIADSGRNLFLEANQKVYFRITGNGTLKVTGTELARLTKAHTKESPLEVKAGYVAFTAWEDNAYTIWLNGKEVSGYMDKVIAAGSTEYIAVGNDGKMYVTCHDAAALTPGEKSEVVLDGRKQAAYFSYTAGITGEYTLTYKKDAGIELKVINAADGETLSELYTETNTETETIAHYSLKEGQKILVEFKAEPEITDNEKKLSAYVTIAYVNLGQKITLNEETAQTAAIAKGTTEIVQVIIPQITGDKAKFQFAAAGEDGTEIVGYYDKNYSELRIDHELTISKNDKKYKAGDSIYVQVTAGAGKTGDETAKDAVLTATPVSVKTLVSADTVTVNNDTEQWYAFTAPKDGYYEFGVTVAERDGEDNTPTHSASIDIYTELFGGSSVAGNVTTTKILRMRTGEMIAVKLSHGTVADITKDDGTTEAVKSNVTISVNPLEISPLSVNEEKSVQIPAKGSEVRYYSFTAAVEDDYTIMWQAADTKTDNTEVTYCSSITTQSGLHTVAASGSSIRLKSGEVRYIRVKIVDPAGENPVNGTLLVKAANLNADALTDGTPYAYVLEDKDAAGSEKVVRFTAPESGFYEIVTSVDINATDGLPYKYPTVKCAKNGNTQTIAVPYASMELEKGGTIYITLSFEAGGSEVKETKGTVTIKTRAKPLTGDQTDVSVENGVTEEYTYTIPESGRYEFKADYDKEKATVEWKNTDGKTLEDGNYYLKNTKVKAAVTGCDEDAGASVKLYKPALISTTILNVGENAVEVKAGETKYYELSVGSEPRDYEFELSEITGTATVNMTRVTDSNNNWSKLPDDSGVPMKKNSKLIIRITSSSEKKDAKCKLNITEVQELKLGENPVHLESGESRDLVYRIPETGYYSFYINQPGAELVLNYNYTYYGNVYSDTKIGDSFYNFTVLNAKQARTCRLTNEGSSAVDLTLIVDTIEPVGVTPGSKTEEKTVPAGQRAHYALKTFKNAEYLIKINDTSKGEDLKVSMYGQFVTEELKKTVDGVTLERTLNGETLLCITNNGIKETSVTVELTMTEAQPLPDETITLAKNESRLISFVATEDTRYLIAKDNEKVRMTLVSEQKVSSGETTYPDETVNAYTERALNKGDKLVYRLSYEPDADDKKVEDSQAVNVKIEKIVPTSIEAESIPVTIAGKDNRSVWYQFTAAKDAVHTFVLEDELGNKVDGTMTFYRYFTDAEGNSNAERYMETSKRVYINVNYPDAGSYTLKYTTVEAIAETGSKTLDFEYKGEVQEVKFVVPRGGIYKVSATAVRGGFRVVGKIGTQVAVDSFDTSDSRKSILLKKDDIVTFTLTATQGGKSSVTLRIAEDNMAEMLESGREYAGTSDTEKDIYYEIRVDKTALYAITAGGEPAIWYAVNDDNLIQIDGVVYKELNKEDRIIIKVGTTTTEKAYTVKVEEISTTSLDGKNTEEAPYSVSLGDNHYGFTTANAYAQFKVPEDGKYYIAVQTINDNTGYGDMTVETPAPTTDPTETPTPAAKAVPDIVMQTLTKDQIVKFTFTNDNPKDEENPSMEYKEALFRLTIEKAPAEENPITAGETKSDLLAAGKTISYQFKAGETGKYRISFNGSNCTLSGALDGEVKQLAKDETLTLTVGNDTNGKAGYYELTVAKLVPDTLNLGETAQKTLKKGEKAYYEFDSTETTDTGETVYQIYISGEGVQYTYSKVDAEGVEFSDYGSYTNCNCEVALKKGEKLAFTVENNSDTMNRSFKLTVKKVEYIKDVKADTPVSGTLEAYENAYYEFTSENESENGTTYEVSSDKISVADSVRIQKIQKQAWEKDSEGKDVLGTPTDVTGQETFTLKKGEKLLITVANNSGKTAQFELTVEKKAEPVVTYEAIALDEKKIGKLAEDEKAGYEFTVSDAADYSVYFSGTSCSYTWTTTEERQVTGEDGTPTTKTETVTKTGKLDSGSNELTLKQGDKICFAISGTEKYELTVKKVAYAPLTSGTTVAKTLNPKEIAYYQFASQDDPAAGETTTKYQVYGSFSGYTVQTRTVTTGEDGKPVNSSWSNRNSEYNLEKGQILQFKVTGGSNAKSQFKLTIKKVEYIPMTLGAAVEGRLDIAESGYAYYEFTSNDDPAEGQTATEYQIYGTANYDCTLVTVNEDNTLTVTGLYTKKPKLEKGQRLRFRVRSSSNSAEGYNLTVAKTGEKAITVGSETETGSLGKGQQLVYTYKYAGEAPSSYTVSYKQDEDVEVTVSRNGSALGIEDQQRIILSKDDILMINIKASDETDNFEFTVSEFKPEALTLGSMTSLRTLSANETVYYQYNVAESGSYVISMVESSDGLPLSYEVTRADAELKAGTINGGIGELTGLEKDDIVLLKVSASAARAAAVYSFRLMIQKAAPEESMTALPWSGSLQPGEVKYFKFTIPEADKENTSEYIVTITGSSDQLGYWYDGNEITASVTEPYSVETTRNFVLKVANTSMYSAADCKIEVQMKEEPLDM